MKINKDMIVKDTDPILRQKSADVLFPLSTKDKALLMDMLDYVRKSVDPEIAERENLRPSVGIAAVQLGVLKKLNAISVGLEDKNGDWKMHEFALVNPKIISHSIEKTYLKHGEGCLSVEDEHEGYVPRSARIKVKAYDLLQDKEVTIRVSGYLAIVFQHEIDHNHGVLFYDYINKKDPFAPVEGAFEIE